MEQRGTRMIVPPEARTGELPLEPTLSHRRFAERIIIALAILALALLLWNLRALLILVFGAVLFAVILRIIANSLKDRFGLRDGIALLLAVLFVFGLIGGAGLLFGAEISSQAESLTQTLPQAWQVLQARLEAWGVAEPVQQWLESLRTSSGGSGIVDSLTGILSSVGGAITDVVLVIVGGIFLAVEPDLYRRGLLKLVPRSGRGNLSQALDDCWTALRLWLLARLATMALVGLITGIGLYLIGVPAALTLGLLAGLLDFIPFVGPIIAAVPAVLLALALDPTSALWVVGLYLLVQQIEGNVITPVFQKRAVELPPALLLFALVACGLLFGIAGVLFAEPLTVVTYVLVKRLYVREALNTATPIPGEKDEEERPHDASATSART
jgi:predicted PurR-regulated permease PerM